MNLKLKAMAAVVAFAGLFVMMSLLGAFYTVDEGERAVVKRYGEVVDVTGPGLHFKTPFITDVETVSVQSVKRVYGGDNSLQAYSKDMQIGALIVSLNITPNSDSIAVRDVIVKYGSLDNYMTREVDPKVYQSVKATFAKYTAQSSNENQIALSSAIFEEVRRAVPTNVVTIQSAQIEDIEFSNKFEDAMEQRKLNEIAVERQIQENLKVAEVNKQTVATAEANAKALNAEADAAAYKIRQEATARAEATRLQGEAEASAIKAKSTALANNPGLIDLTRAERWNGALPSTMLGDATVPFMNMSTK